MDPLTFASINMLTNDTKVIGDLINYSGPLQHNSINDLNMQLDSTTIKRACCRNIEGIDGNLKIDVRLPISSDVSPANDIGKKFGYLDKTISIPKSLCASYGYGIGQNSSCDQFYNTYCKNIKESYKKQNNGVFDKNEWVQFKPECACYADIPGDGTYAGISIPTKCLTIGCVEGSAYVSKANSPKCDNIICNAILNTSGAEVGGAINIDSNVIQNCGYSSKSIEGKPTPSQSTEAEKLMPSQPTEGEKPMPSQSTGEEKPMPSQSTEEEKPTGETQTLPTKLSNIKQFFTSEKKYIGYLLLIPVIIILLLIIINIIKK